MSSIVKELQKEITNGDCDITNVLRKAHIIAVKLNLTEFDDWITKELNGYDNYNDIPDYREIRGIFKAFNRHHGWIPVMSDKEEIGECLNKSKMFESVCELTSICNSSKNDMAILKYPMDMSAEFAKHFSIPYLTSFSLHVSVHDIKAIIDKIKTCILDWTLKLEEKGILGDDMTFNNNEIESAKGLPQQIHNYYNCNITGDVENSQIISGNNNTIDYNGNIEEILNELERAIRSEHISDSDISDAIEILHEINDKIEKADKPNIIKALLTGLKTTLTVASAGNGTLALIEKVVDILPL